MDFINSLIDTHNIPVLTAFLLGILTSISPCPLATNITAVAYISKDIKYPKSTIVKGLFYTLGRMISYTLLALLMFFGLSSFQLSSIFQGWGDKVLGLVLILISLVMFGVIKFNSLGNNESIENFKIWISAKGNMGAVLLGMLFAFAFCPYSGVLFFGILTPLILSSKEWILLPPMFALGTGLPVIVFSFLIAFSVSRISVVFSIFSKVEKAIRYIVASVFLVVGIYYLKYLLIWLL